MLDINKLLECAGNNIAETLKMVDPAQIEAIAEAIANAHKSGHNIFTAGWGRAGNIIRILGMDMSQIGMIVYCVGDNSTRSIQAGDILLINSGSGNTKTITIIAQQAKAMGATVALISGNAPDNSNIGEIADINVTVPRLQKNNFRPPKPASREKTHGQRVDWGLTPEQREQMAYDGVTGYYESSFALNEVIKQVVMQKIGAKAEDIGFYHNNLE